MSMSVDDPPEPVLEILKTLRADPPIVVFGSIPLSQSVWPWSFHERSPAELAVIMPPFWAIG